MFFRNENQVNLIKNKRRIRSLVVLIFAPIIVLGIMSATASRPTIPGPKKGRLAEISDSPNCVSTQTNQKDKLMNPIRFEGTKEQAMQRLKTALATLPRITIIKEDSGYLYVEARSRIFRFVDDLEFLINENEQVIHFRAAARSGYSDFGVNHSRMEDLRKAFAEAKVRN